MSEQRRARLRQVILPLVSLDDFSSADAKAICSEAAPGYVTSNLNRLVREGLLTRHAGPQGQRYRWTTKKKDFDPELWIDRQIHGAQVTETPPSQRPRERLLRSGAGSLSNTDLLAILIRVGVPAESAVAGAQKVVNRLGDELSMITQCAPQDLHAISPAVTPASYAQIMAGIELGRRIARMQSQQSRAQTKINSTQVAVEYCNREFAWLAADGVQEEFHIVTLDTKHKPVHCHCITRGTLDASLVHPREVFRPAIRDAAAAILLVHNHPSGDPQPSREDLAVTEQLTEAGSLLGISVLDHIVVARGGSVSIRETGSTR